MKIYVEGIKEFLSRREVMGVFLVLLLFTSFYSMKAIGATSYTTGTVKTSTYTQEGVLTHIALLGNNTLYGPTLSKEYYPSPLVEGFVLNYRYRFTPGDVVRGNYTISGKVTYYVNVGNERVVLWEEPLLMESGELEKGAFSKDFTLNVTKLNNETVMIQEELDLRRILREVSYTVRVNVIGVIEGNTVRESFSQDMNMVKDSSAGVYYFTNTKSAKTGSTTEKETHPTTVSILGMTLKVATAKLVFPILSLLFLTPLLGGLLTVTASRGKTTGLEAYTVEGAPPFVDRKVYLKSFEDLRKTFELLDKPIIHYRDDGDVYVIVEDGVAYEYREN